MYGLTVNYLLLLIQARIQVDYYLLIDIYHRSVVLNGSYRALRIYKLFHLNLFHIQENMSYKAKKANFLNHFY
jgi:hypothetical protein